MLIVKFNSLSSQDLFAIERRLMRWLDNKDTASSPDFNVLDYGRTDLYGHLLGIFAKLDLFDTLGASPSQLLDFFIDVDTTYLDAPYHSFYHAVDIVTMLYFMLTELDAARYLTKHELAALLLSALCHDAGHPGYNNLYQVNFKTELAQRYQNTSVLESYSVDITHQLLRKHNLLKHFKQTTAQGSMTVQEFVDTIDDLILSTDMVYHYELQEELGILEEILGEDQHWSGSTDENSDTDAFFPSDIAHPSTRRSLSRQHGECSDETGSDDGNSQGLPLLSAEHRRSLCRILLHAADISNTVRPWPVSKQWSDLIVQEFFRQGDAEKAAGLTVSPGMDRDLSTQPNISLKFGDFVVKPYFQALADLFPSARLFLDALGENRAEWERLKHSPAAATPSPSYSERQFPASLLPAQPVLNPTGRRVSVAAGVVVIADGSSHIPRRRQRSTMVISRRHHISHRSSSHSGVLYRTLAVQRENGKEELAYHRFREQTYTKTLSPFSLKPVIFSPPMTVFNTDQKPYAQRIQRQKSPQAL